MRELRAYLLVGLKDESEKDIFIEDFEQLSMADAKVALSEAYRVLALGGLVECAVLNWGWLVERYLCMNGTDAELGRMLFEAPRRAVWDERTIGVACLKAGFYKSWAGRVAELPEHMFWAKGLKWIPPTDLGVG